MGVSTRGVVARLAEAGLTLLLAGVIGAALICWAPGTGTDERELSTGLSEQTIAVLRNERAAEASLLQFLPRYAADLIRWDLGRSHAFNQPVSELIGARLRLTLGVVAGGLALAWTAGLVVVVVVVLGRVPLLGGLSTGLSGVLLCLPAGLVALVLAIWKLPVSLGIAMAVFPKVYVSAEALLGEQSSRLHVLAARARGVSVLRLAGWHLLKPAARPLAALGVVSLMAAIGVAVPIEALTDTPGIGQLVLRATLARDVRLLVGLTLVVTALGLAANLAADLLSAKEESSGNPSCGR
jgi:peptide/nickel transport system permease protein